MTSTISENALDILSKVKSPKFEDILKSSLASGYDDYDNNAHNTNEVDVAGLENFCKMVYTDWRQMMIDNYDQLSPLAKTVAEVLRDNKIFDPANIEKKSGTPFYNFLLRGYDKVFKNTGTRPAELQSGITIIPTPDEASDGFLHVFGYQLVRQNKEKTEGRLYLNLKAKNLPSFATEAYKKCKEKNLPFYFKFTIQDNRNDPFLFYSSYENLDKYIEIIEEIKKERPELLEGCEKVSQNLGKLNEFIGYGDEPSLKHESFNSVRRQAIDGIRNKLFKEFNNKFKSTNKTETPLDKYCDTKIDAFAKRNNINIDIDFYGYSVKERVYEIFRKNIKNLILTEKPIEDIDVIINGKSLVKLPISTIDWLKELEQDFGKNLGTSIKLRGALAKNYIFPQGQSKEDGKKLNTIVKNLLVAGLKIDQSNYPNDKEIADLINILDKEPNKLDKDALSYILLSSANFIENKNLYLKGKKSYHVFNEQLLDVYKYVLGEDKVEEIIDEACIRYDISKDNLCFNSTTDILVEKNKEKYEEEKV